MAQTRDYLSYLKNKFHDIFNTNNNTRSDVAAFFAAPTEGNVYNYAELIVWPFTLLKNISKFFIEFIPGFFEASGDYLYDKAKALKTQSDPKNETRAFGNFLMIVGGIVSGVFKLIRLAAMRLTSPIRSMKEAYQFGSEYHKALGVILGGVSILLSLAMTSATLFIAGPFLAAKMGLVFLGAGLKAITAYTSSLFGIASTTSSTLLGIGALIVAPFVAFKALIKPFFSKTPQKELLTANENLGQELPTITTAIPQPTKSFRPVSLEDELEATIQANTSEIKTEQEKNDPVPTSEDHPGQVNKKHLEDNSTKPNNVTAASPSLEININIRGRSSSTDSDSSGYSSSPPSASGQTTPPILPISSDKNTIPPIGIGSTTVIFNSLPPTQQGSWSSKAGFHSMFGNPGDVIDYTDNEEEITRPPFSAADFAPPPITVGNSDTQQPTL